MKILISGSSQGIGRVVAIYFLDKGYDVIGFDVKPSSINNEKYQHFVEDISKKDEIIYFDDIDILFNNAGTVNSISDIDNNLKGTINLTEKYINCPSLKSILFNASSSAHTGFEFYEYAASKGGVITYMKNVACRLASRGVTVNSISLGGVITASNDVVMNDEKCWEKIIKFTPLKKWMKEEEVAEWVYFLTVINKSASGQDFLIDNGEKDLNNTFVWPR